MKYEEIKVFLDTLKEKAANLEDFRFLVIILLEGDLIPGDMTTKDIIEFLKDLVTIYETFKEKEIVGKEFYLSLYILLTYERIPKDITTEDLIKFLKTVY